MKKFNFYFIGWLISIILFNVFVFAIPTSIDGWTVMKIVAIVSVILGSNAIADGKINVEMLKPALEKGKTFIANNKEEIDKAIITAKKALDEPWFYKYGGAFWPGYIFIMIAYLIQIACAFICFKEKNSTKRFYKIPLIVISYIGLIITTIVGILCMFFPDVPAWLGTIVCAIVVVFNIVALVEASATSSIISDKDDKLAASTSFMKKMIAEASALDTKDELLNKVYEAFRYSDPVSRDDLADIERKIEDKFNEIKDLNAKGKDISKAVDDILIIIEERNSKCKYGK